MTSLSAPVHGKSFRPLRPSAPRTACEKEKSIRQVRDREALIEAFGKEKADRIDQIVLHFRGPRWAIWPDRAEATAAEDRKAREAMRVTRPEMFRIMVPIIQNFEATKPNAEAQMPAKLREYYDQEFLKALTLKQRDAWAKLAGPKPTMPIPKGWPKLREPMF